MNFQINKSTIIIIMAKHRTKWTNDKNHEPETKWTKRNEWRRKEHAIWHLWGSIKLINYIEWKKNTHIKREWTYYNQIYTNINYHGIAVANNNNTAYENLFLPSVTMMMMMINITMCYIYTIFLLYSFWFFQWFVFFVRFQPCALFGYEHWMEFLFFHHHHPHHHHRKHRQYWSSSSSTSEWKPNLDFFFFWQINPLVRCWPSPQPKKKYNKISFFFLSDLLFYPKYIHTHITDIKIVTNVFSFVKWFSFLFFLQNMIFDLIFLPSNDDDDEKCENHNAPAYP